MSISQCPNRIKPTLLRDIKTEALLVFIRTTLEQFFEDIEKNGAMNQVGSEEDNEILYSTLKQLLLHLQDTVVNSTYIRSVISTSQKSKAMNIIALKEKPLFTYYDTIVKQIERSLSQGANWIPEQLVVCLLCQWIIEEEKSIELYPFLKQIDYLSLLDRYDQARIQAKKEEDWNKVSAIMSMYNVSTQLIERLKKINYKVNTKRVSKTRGKRK